MAEFQDPTNTEIESEQPVSFQSARILKHFPRHLVQKAISLTPLQFFCSQSSEQKKPEVLAPALTEKSIQILESKNAIKNVMSEQEQPEEESESLGLGLLKKIKCKVKEFFSNPIDLLERGLNIVTGACSRCFNRMCEAFLEIPEIVKTAFTKAIKFIKGVFDSAAEESLDGQVTPNYSVDKKAWFVFKAAENLNNVKHTNGSVLNSGNWKALELDDRQEEKSKNPLTLLLAGLKQVVEALLEKRHKKEHENCVEEARQQELKTEAKENAEKAQNLRPDLAEFIHLPETDFLFASPLNQVPSVLGLIEEAEKEAKKAKIH